MQNYKIVISYEGTDYQGWQRQPDKRTIQGLLENALEKIAAKKIPVIGSRAKSLTSRSIPVWKTTSSCGRLMASFPVI